MLVFSGTVQAGIFKFIIHMENEWLHHEVQTLGSLLIFFHFSFFPYFVYIENCSQFSQETKEA